MPSSHQRPLDECGPDRELRGGEIEGLARVLLGDPFDFIEHLAGLDHRDPELDVALASAHAHLERLLADRLVREDPDPELAAALHVAADRAARGLDLARRQAPGADGLEAVLAEAHARAAGRDAAIAPLALLPELRFLRLHHGGITPLRCRRL